MVTKCARCSHRISVFAKKRKCASCLRRLCKECHAKDAYRAPPLARSSTSPHLSASTFLRPPSPFRDSNEGRPSFEHSELTRHGSLPNILQCSFGCKDDGLDLLPEATTPLVMDSSPEASEINEAAAPAPSASDDDSTTVADDDELTLDSRLHRVPLTLATDTTRGFVVSVWLCMLWAVVSGSLVHRSVLSGLGASVVLALSVGYCQGSALVFQPYSKNTV
ncbi:hypothetical protein SPRG_04399 [Saprolegnia parasitica CBS 223.65]|uniref:Uncharacterized protein n=1 Tax=Saprolegnia parasitica (strain CBS 223.65) TaxID=695850 RepID=A0A067CUM0_SAPPC|nr:hypothetical protein SPRG_04399 [Saprolegnia parasitica CBS 223.65]KDO30497.1 hypothetical protein SPRG_04399 [Saprolegnia parasitica CBS 223.65]|eukprot:XP_012198715.1 hypothetical protein SPRG_04399 [Saprolegnia parasitica CBS 223.65]